MELDRIDAELLALLQNNARLSNKELAASIGLAPSTCHERVRRLQAAGALRGFHADVDPRMLGIGLQALVSVRLGRHSHDIVESFREHAMSQKEVVALYHVAGAHDFLLHVVVRNPEQLRGLILDAFTTREEAMHVETALVYEVWRKPSLPDLRE
ncbi:MAG TPA: Lrp/AsnC family transcriptional regulator [Blastocatellia bacterium]|nr:Lrp/AsnC family transcriptional regulator [Blastocatellia bacterium]